MNIDKLYTKLNIFDNPKNAINSVPNKYKIIDYGSSRLIIEDLNNKNNIIKLEIRNTNENENEVTIWNRYKKHNISKFLLPVLEYEENYNWIKMPKVKCELSVVQRIHGPKSKQIYKKLSKHGIYLFDLETGIYKNKPVAYDYGSIEILL